MCRATPKINCTELRYNFVRLRKCVICPWRWPANPQHCLSVSRRTILVEWHEFTSAVCYGLVWELLLLPNCSKLTLFEGQQMATIARSNFSCLNSCLLQLLTRLGIYSVRNMPSLQKSQACCSQSSVSLSVTCSWICLPPANLHWPRWTTCEFSAPGKLVLLILALTITLFAS